MDLNKNDVSSTCSATPTAASSEASRCQGSSVAGVVGLPGSSRAKETCIDWLGTAARWRWHRIWGRRSEAKEPSEECPEATDVMPKVTRRRKRTTSPHSSERAFFVARQQHRHAAAVDTKRCYNVQENAGKRGRENAGNRKPHERHHRKSNQVVGSFSPHAGTTGSGFVTVSVPCICSILSSSTECPYRIHETGHLIVLVEASAYQPSKFPDFCTCVVSLESTEHDISTESVLNQNV